MLLVKAPQVFHAADIFYLVIFITIKILDLIHRPPFKKCQNTKDEHLEVDVFPPTCATYQSQNLVEVSVFFPS